MGELGGDATTDEGLLRNDLLEDFRCPRVGGILI